MFEIWSRFGLTSGVECLTTTWNAYVWRCKENENFSSIFVQIVVFSQPDHKKTMSIIKEGANLISENTKKETNMKTIDNKTLYSNFVVLTSQSSML